MPGLSVSKLWQKTLWNDHGPFIISGEDDPSIVGLDYPLRSIYLRTNGEIWQKVGSMDTQWNKSTGGSISEEDLVYAKRVDFISETVLYRGEAAVGSAESDAVWRVRRITLSSDDDVTEVWAAGTATFDKVWDDRASLSYS